jgi:hypothetical protein
VASAFGKLVRREFPQPAGWDGRPILRSGRLPATLQALTVGAKGPPLGNVSGLLQPPAYPCTNAHRRSFPQPYAGTRTPELCPHRLTAVREGTAMSICLIRVTLSRRQQPWTGSSESPSAFDRSQRPASIGNAARNHRNPQANLCGSLQCVSDPRLMPLYRFIGCKPTKVREEC